MTHRTKVHSEIELKFELSARAAEKLRRHVLISEADHQTYSQSSVYFDTGKSEVHKAGYSLRVRQVGDSFTQTVKRNAGSAGLFDRGEWEAGVEQMAPDPKALKRTPLSKFQKLDRKVEPVVCSDVERTIWLIDHDDCVAEVVLDSGTVSAGDQKAAFHELELELKDGEPAAIFNFAQELGETVPLQLGVLSKEERGLMLGDGAFGREHKASAPDICRIMDVGQVFALIVHGCIRHFRLNEELIITERDPEALHQARVPLRPLPPASFLFPPAIRPTPL